MALDRTRSGIAVAAIGRVLVFGALFVVLQLLLSRLLLATLPGDALVLDTTALLAAAVIAGLVMLRLVEHRPGADLGFALERRASFQLGIGTALGVSGLVVACAALVLVGTLRFTSDVGTVGGWLTGITGMLLVLLIPAAAEEALFRGYPFQKLVEGFGPVLATLGASAAFAVAHMNNPSVNGFALANIFAAGVMLSVAYLRTRSLWFATGVHLGWNWSMAALLDLPVSGLELFDAPLYEPRVRGPAWLSGGAFGPEGSIAGFAGLMLVLAGVIVITRKTRWLI